MRSDHVRSDHVRSDHVRSVKDRKQNEPDTYCRACGIVSFPGQTLVWE